MRIFKFIILSVIAAPLIVACSTSRPNIPLPLAGSLTVETARDKANVIFSGHFEVGRTPCYERPDGTREWFRTTGFTVEEVFTGKVLSYYIEVHLAEFVANENILEAGSKYFVFLNADKTLLNRLTQPGSIGWQEGLGDNVVVAILDETGKSLIRSHDNKQIDLTAAH